MHVNIQKLSKILRNKKLKEWLQSHIPKDELSEFLSVSKKNKVLLQAKTASLYNKICGLGLDNEFKQYLISNHLDAIDQDTDLPDVLQLMQQSMEDPNKIFSNYHPLLLRFPMQIILKSENLNRLTRAVKSLENRFHICENLLIGDFAYVEYLPPSLAGYADDIPTENWEIRKRKNEVKDAV
jgi:hypothetical protein